MDDEKSIALDEFRKHLISAVLIMDNFGGTRNLADITLVDLEGINMNISRILSMIIDITASAILLDKLAVKLVKIIKD